MTALVRYDEACRALAAARAVDEVKDIADKAIALQAYARQAKNKQLEVDAGDIRFRAERRLGEMLAEQKATIGLQAGARGIGQPRSGVPEKYPTIPTLGAAGIEKKLSARAQKLAAIPEAKFEAMLGDWRERVSAENERVTNNLIREGERAQRNAEIPIVQIPTGKYNLIYADPPWRYEHVKTDSRRIENQYPTMDLAEICALPIADILADDAVLFLWTTSPKLAESLEVVKAWGFLYRTCAVWDKGVIGMGYYFRQQHELLLVATRGQPGAPDESVRVSSIIKSPREQHSAKPEQVYSLLENMYPHAVRVELFARGQHEGWASWGNQVAT